jgi:branched-chain amino acid transport system permease protein
MIYLQSAINGVGIGSMYALVGLAAMFVLRVTGVLNFAVGGIVILGGLLATSLTGIPAGLLIVVMIALGAPAGVIAHFASTRWLRQSSTNQFSGVLVTVALATALQGLGYLLYSSDVRFAPRIVKQHSYQLTDSLTVDTSTLVLLAAVAVGYIACWLVLDKVNLGRALRAVSDDRVAARLAGLSIVRIELASYAILGALAFFVGSVAAQVVGVTADNVFPILVGALFGLVLGGSGNVLGPLVGGMLIGMAQSIANARLSQFWGVVVELAVALVVLGVAPGGIFPDRRMRSVA